MKNPRLLALPVLISILLVALAPAVTAQVATLRTPGPDAEPSPAPAEEVDGQEAILQFAACLRDNGIDIPDPRFGVGGGAFGGGDGTIGGVDIMSKEFLDAMEACQSLLEAVQPEIDPEQQAEQNEQLLAFAECMRGQDIEFPDPDPIRGFSLGMLRGEDGGLAFDPFSPEFQEATRTCVSAISAAVPDGVSAPGS